MSKKSEKILEEQTIKVLEEKVSKKGSTSKTTSKKSTSKNSTSKKTVAKKSATNKSANKTEESVKKASATKRTIKIPNSSVEEKEVKNGSINNDVLQNQEPKDIKENSTVKKSKRTLRLNLGKNNSEQINEDKENIEIKNSNITETQEVSQTDTMIVDIVNDINTELEITSPVVEELSQDTIVDTGLDITSNTDTDTNIDGVTNQKVETPDNIPTTTIKNTISVNQNSSFFNEPSVFEKFNIDVVNKDTSDDIPTSSEPTVNLNSSFFYTPSIFEKFDIEITETDTSKTQKSNIVKTHKKETSNTIKNKVIHTSEKITQNDVTESQGPISLNNLISFDDEIESVEHILDESIKNSIGFSDVDTIMAEDIIEEELTPSTDIVNKTTSINTNLLNIFDELSKDIDNNTDIENNLGNTNLLNIFDELSENVDSNSEIEILDDNLKDTNLLNIFNEFNEDTDIDETENDISNINNDVVLKEVADTISTEPENKTVIKDDSIVGKFFKNSATPISEKNDSSIFSKAKKSLVSNITSVFKKFSYEEADLINSENDFNNDISIQKRTNLSDIQQVLGNFDNNIQKDITELDVSAEPVGINIPTLETDTDVLMNTDLSNNSNGETSSDFYNIITPETKSDDLDDELLDLLEAEDISSEELIENLEETSNDNTDKDILDISVPEYEENIELESNIEDDDEFSIENYFGLNKIDSEQEKTETSIENEDNTANTIENAGNKKENQNDDEIILEDNADIEFDTELLEDVNENDESIDVSEKMSKDELSSLSKLFNSFTETISSLSNRLTELETTKQKNNEIKENNIKTEDTVLNNTTEEIIPEVIENADQAPISSDETSQEIELDINDINLEDLDLNEIDLLNETNPEENNEVDIEDINVDDISIDDIDLEDISLIEDSIETQEEDLSDSPVSIEDILSNALSNDSNIDNEMKEKLLSEVLSEELAISNNEDSIIPNNSENNNITNTTSGNDDNPTSDFLKIIDSLSKTISELESSNDSNEIVEEKNQYLPTDSDESGKAINILINKDDIFSISILNETYEIVADFDGISVISENIHISTPKNNFFVKVGEKFIEIHNYKTYFLVQTSFEDVEFANAINNVAFAKKNNKIELNIKEAFKLSSVNNKIELSMLNTSIAGIANSQGNYNNDDSSICDNKTLLISEETQKVYLPYSIEDVMKKLNNSENGYQTVDEVVKNEYTLPLTNFKMPIISRFREAYRFMRTKEHSSVYAAVDLALELMFNSNLNPAVIRASKDLKELNIYLDCLYENELDKFDCFKIVYKVLPKIQ